MDKQKSQVLALFGTALRSARLRAGLSQEELAHLADIDRSYLGAIERGEHNLALLNITKLANALKISPSEFFQNQK